MNKKLVKSTLTIRLDAEEVAALEDLKILFDEGTLTGAIYYAIRNYRDLHNKGMYWQKRSSELGDLLNDFIRDRRQARDAEEGLLNTESKYTELKKKSGESIQYNIKNKYGYQRWRNH